MEIVKQKFIIGGTVRDRNKFYKLCKETNTPFIVAYKYPYKRVYHVKADLVTCSNNFYFGETVINLAKKLFDEEEDYIESLRHPQTKWFSQSFGSEIISIDTVTKEHVESFCMKLYYIVNNYAKKPEVVKN